MNAARRARKKANHQAAKERRELEGAAIENLGVLVKRVYSESEKAAAQTALANLRKIRKKLSDGDNLPQ